jgi:uncharacterized protein
MLLPNAFHARSGQVIAAAFVAAAASLAPIGKANAAPSFDCRAISLAAERAVCNTPSVHALDRNLDRLYRDTIGQARRVSDARAVETVKTAQRQFLTSRNSCGPDIECIKITYRGQFGILRSYLRQLD